MSDRVSKEEEDEIIRLWLYEHMSYTQIKAKTGRSLDTISRIITEYKKKNPNADQVREVIAKVSASNKTIPDVLRVLNTLEDLEKVGITSEQITQCWNLIKRYGVNATPVLEAGVRLDALQSQTGLEYSEIERRYRTWDQTKARIADDELREKTLESEIQNLEELKQIQEVLKENQIDTLQLSSFIEFHKTLKGLKFSRNAATSLATELANANLTVEEGSRKVVEMIKEYGGTAGAIQARKDELKEIDDRKIKVGGELKSLQILIDDLNLKMESANASFSEKVDEIAQLVIQKEDLEGQISDLSDASIRKKEELDLADSVMTLVTNHKGLSAAQLNLLCDKMNQARENREKKYYVTADEQISSAVTVLSNYLVPVLQQQISELKRSRDSAQGSTGAELEEKQKLAAELKKIEKVIQRMNSFFTDKAAHYGWLDQLGYDCPLCNAPIFLTPRNTKGSIKVTCGNCRKPSTSTLQELYQMVLKNEK